MKQLEELLRNCPHAVIKFNDDPGTEDADGMVPVGYSIRVQAEDPTDNINVSGPTLGECIDNLSATLRVRST